MYVGWWHHYSLPCDSKVCYTWEKHHHAGPSSSLLPLLPTWCTFWVRFFLAFARRQMRTVVVIMTTGNINTTPPIMGTDIISILSSCRVGGVIIEALGWDGSSNGCVGGDTGSSGVEHCTLNLTECTNLQQYRTLATTAATVALPAALLAHLHGYPINAHCINWIVDSYSMVQLLLTCDCNEIHSSIINSHPRTHEPLILSPQVASPLLNSLL